MTLAQHYTLDLNISLGTCMSRHCMRFPPGHVIHWAPRAILGAPFAPLRVQWPAGLLLLANAIAERTPAAISQTKTIPSTQPACSRSRVPVCLRVLPVPERVPLEL